ARSKRNGEEELDREEQPATQDGEEVRRTAQPAEGDRTRQEPADGGAVRRHPEAGRTAAEFLRHPDPQSLRIVRPAARLLPQAPSQPYRFARARVEGPDSRAREVELVRRLTCQ